MRITGIALFALSMMCVASTDPVITTSATCFIFGEHVTTTTGSCSLGTPPTQSPYPPYASATISTSVGQQQTASDWLTISMRVDVSAIYGARYLGVPNAASAANGQNRIHIDFITPGPERAGILEEQWLPVWSGNPGDFEGAATYTIGNYSGGCGGGGNPNCTGPTPKSSPIPFELGTAFTFDSWNWLEAGTSQGNSAGYAGIDLQLRFLEADGLTPVIAIDRTESLPEPATFALIGLGLLGCGWLRRKR